MSHKWSKLRPKASENRGKMVLVNMQHVSTIWPGEDGQGSQLWLVAAPEGSKQKFEVEETPEDIAAMYKKH